MQWLPPIVLPSSTHSPHLSVDGAGLRVVRHVSCSFAGDRTPTVDGTFGWRICTRMTLLRSTSISTPTPYPKPASGCLPLTFSTNIRIQSSSADPTKTPVGVQSTPWLEGLEVHARAADLAGHWAVGCWTLPNVPRPQAPPCGH